MFYYYRWNGLDYWATDFWFGMYDNSFVAPFFCTFRTFFDFFHMCTGMGSASHDGLWDSGDNIAYHNW